MISKPYSTASGIGLATARLFAHKGARVCLLDRDLAAAQAAASAIPGASACFVDVADRDSADRAVDAAAEAMGAIHILVHCAGMASQAGIVAIDKHAAYSASKAGIISMVKSLAHEWGRYGIQVNAISPTATETPIIMGYWDVGEVHEKAIANTPAGRFCKPEEIAAAAFFLATDAANMITGSNLVVDGGYTIH